MICFPQQKICAFYIFMEYVKSCTAWQLQAVQLRETKQRLNYHVFFSEPKWVMKLFASFLIIFIRLSVCLPSMYSWKNCILNFFLIYFLIKCKRYKFYIIYIYCLIIYLCNAFFYNITIYIFILFFYKMFILHYFFSII